MGLRATGLSLVFLALGATPAFAGGLGGLAPAVGADGARDVVLAGPPSPAADRKAARADGNRYPVGDGAGRTVQIDVTLTCANDPVNCPDADPSQLALFLGTLPHRGEISSLRVLVAHPLDMQTHCGDASALACYYSDRNQMVIPGRDFVAGDGADRDFVIAHEYGHHVANHRRNPPFVPTIYHGTKRWGTYERVCPGTRSGRYFPGNQGDHYYDNPGEAFAEAYAFTHYGNNPGVVWNWDPSLRPDAGASAALLADVFRPWLRRTRLVRRGRVGRREGRVTKRVATPLDGDVGIVLRGRPGAQLDLLVRNRRGRVIARSSHWGAVERVRLEVCGQRLLRVTVKRRPRRPGGAFRLVIRRP